MEPDSGADKPAAQDRHAGEQQSALKLAIELGPLLVFFITYVAYGIYPATAAIMVATIFSVAASIILFRKISPVPVVTAVILCVFGGMAFWWKDPRFLYVKPTIVNLLFAAVLGAGLMARRPVIKYLLGSQVQLTDDGWRKLSVRWMIFFVFLAVLNEFVWRYFSEATWVSFKAFGILPLTIVFAAAQIGLLKRYQATD